MIFTFFLAITLAHCLPLPSGIGAGHFDAHLTSHDSVTHGQASAVFYDEPDSFLGGSGNDPHNPDPAWMGASGGHTMPGPHHVSDRVLHQSHGHHPSAYSPLVASSSSGSMHLLQSSGAYADATNQTGSRGSSGGTRRTEYHPYAFGRRPLRTPTLPIPGPQLGAPISDLAQNQMHDFLRSLETERQHSASMLRRQNPGAHQTYTATNVIDTTHQNLRPRPGRVQYHQDSVASGSGNAHTDGGQRGYHINPTTPGGAPMPPNLSTQPHVPVSAHDGQHPHEDLIGAPMSPRSQRYLDEYLDARMAAEQRGSTSMHQPQDFGAHQTHEQYTTNVFDTTHQNFRTSGSIPGIQHHQGSMASGSHPSLSIQRHASVSAYSDQRRNELPAPGPHHQDSTPMASGSGHPDAYGGYQSSLKTPRRATMPPNLSTQPHSPAPEPHHQGSTQHPYAYSRYQSSLTTPRRATMPPNLSTQPHASASVPHHQDFMASGSQHPGSASTSEPHPPNTAGSRVDDPSHPFPCPHPCEMKYRSMADLNQHIKSPVHNGDRLDADELDQTPFKCDFRNCHREFKTLDGNFGLAKHADSHPEYAVPEKYYPDILPPWRQIQCLLATPGDRKCNSPGFRYAMDLWSHNRDKDAINRHSHLGPS